MSFPTSPTNGQTTTVVGITYQYNSTDGTWTRVSSNNIIISGYANVGTSVNSALLTVGTSFVANTTGVYHLNLVNAASHTTAGVTANATGVYPSSNSLGTGLGTSTQRWVINANTIDASGLITGSAGANISGTSNLVDVFVSGNLTVSGTTTYINTTNLNIGDNIISLNADLTGATAPTENAGLEVNRGSSANVNFLWNETSDSWTLGNTSITGYANATVSVNSALLTVGNSFIANTTGAYHTGTINATSYTTSGIVANTSGVYPTSNTVGTALGSNTSRWNITANAAGFTGQVEIADTWDTADGAGALYLNAATGNRIDWNINGVAAPAITTRSAGTKLVLYPQVSAASVDFGLGIETNHMWFSVADTGDGFKWYANTSQLAVANTSGITIGSGGLFPTSNSTATSLGSATQRWVLNANTGSFAGAVSGITTLAAGNTTVTGFVNATSTIQGGSSLTIAGALSGVTTAAMGNTTITGFANASVSVNSALLTVGTSFIANTTGAYHTGTVNAATLSTGTINATSNGIIANTTVITFGNSSVNVSINTSSVNVATHLSGAINATSNGFLANSSTITVGNSSVNISITTAGITSSGGTGVNPFSNAVGTALGTTTQRWVVTANSITTSGSGSIGTTLAAGNTTVTGFVNATSTIQGGSSLTIAGALSGVTTAAMGNTTITGFVNATSTIQGGSSLTIAGALSGVTTAAMGNTTITGFANVTSTIQGGAGLTIAGAASGITTLAAGNTTITGFANITSTIQGGSSLTIAGALSGVTTAAMGNTTVTGFANVTGSIQGGSTLTISGAASGITTLAAGNTTITGFANVSTSVNSALLTVGTSFIANTTGVYHTGLVNAASINIGGSGFIANSTAIVLAEPVTANGTTGTSGQVLTSNGTTGAPYWTTLSSGLSIGGSNTQVQYNNSGALGGNSLFTFDQSTNILSVGNNTTGSFNLGFATASTNRGIQVQKIYASDASPATLYIDTTRNNATLTAARSIVGIQALTVSNTADANSTGGVQGSDGYGIYSTMYNGELNTNNARINNMYAGYFVARNYAGGATANTVDAAHGGYFNVGVYGSGNITTAYGTRVLIAPANTTVAGGITTAYGHFANIQSNTASAIQDAYMYYGVYNGTNYTGTAKFGIYITGESNNYFSNNVTVGGNAYAVIFSATSDERLKSNIEIVGDPIEKIKSLKGVNFTYTASNTRSIGVIAQDVEQQLPELVDINSEGYKQVNYNGIIGVLIEAVKQQQKEIDELKQVIERLK